LHRRLSWDTTADAIEFFSMFSGYVGMIDPEPTIVDPDSFQVLAWDASYEAGRAWIDRGGFDMIVSTNPDDLARALELLDAPNKLPQSSYLMP
jgi:hypothetical protein